jgi:prolipoprotein diacylglyceryltransferase
MRAVAVVVVVYWQGGVANQGAVVWICIIAVLLAPSAWL